MARKLTYPITRFDGGITDNVRSQDLSKCAFVSHFDIYSNPYRLTPMPGYIADQDTVAGGADDLQNYNIRAFTYDGTLYAVGEKSGGTGSKLFSKASPTTASWTAVTSGEGTDDIADNTFLHSDPSQSELYFVTNATNTYISKHALGVGTTDKVATLMSGISELQHVVEYAPDDKYYFNTGQDDVALVDGGSITDPAKNTTQYITDIQSGNEQLGLAGFRFYPYRQQLMLWDTASALLDRNIELGEGREVAVGYVGNTWVVAQNEGFYESSVLGEQTNGRHSLAFKYVSGDDAVVLTRINGVVATNADWIPTRGKYRDSMLVYAKIPQDATPTTYKQGIWAVGRAHEGAPLAVSLLLDTTSLGSIEGYYQFGNHHYFAHSGDGSVSRLDNFRTGTYDVDAEYQSLIFGSETANLKEFNGLAVLTEDLPAGGEVEAFVRFDSDDSWTSLGTSDTDGDEKHVFTRNAGVPLGKFREMQFRVVVTGKVVIKSMHLSIVETDDLGFNL